MLNRSVQKKRKLWSEAGQKALRELPLEGWAARRREDLLQLLAGLDPQIRVLDEEVERAAEASEAGGPHAPDHVHTIFVRTTTTGGAPRLAVFETWEKSANTNVPHS
jgi:hypothetical protein